MLRGRLSTVSPQAEVSAARPQVQAVIKRAPSVVYAQHKSSPASCQALAMSDQPRSDALFRFGIVSDVQYADIADGHSHKGTPRYYRAALDGLKRAVTCWQQQEVAFAMHLGDIVDGFNPPEVAEVALHRVTSTFDLLQRPVYHMLGNHCLYNLTRPILNKALRLGPAPGGASYYSFTPHPTYRFIVTDSYDVSVLGWPKGHPRHEQALQILNANNPNENKNQPEGLAGSARRYVQFGGGISDQQMQWLRSELTAARAAKQKAVLFGHIPIHPDTCPPVCLSWSFEELLDICQEFSRTVVATFTGHAHADGAAFDEQSSVHHRVLNAVVETLPGSDCYGVVDVFEDCLRVTGFGRLETADMPVGPRAAAPQHLDGPVPDVQPGLHQHDQILEQAAIARQA